MSQTTNKEILSHFEQLTKLSSEGKYEEVKTLYNNLVKQGVGFELKCDFEDSNVEETGQIDQLNELYLGGYKVSEWYCYWSYDYETDQESEYEDICVNLDENECEFDVEKILEELNIEIEEPDKSLWTDEMN